jgi:hypothetical protein
MTDLATTTYTAHFQAEAWVDEYAVPVDPMGPEEWDCTKFARDHADYVDRLSYLDRRYDDALGPVDRDDLFADDPAAPEWVRTWQGPFTIRIRANNPSGGDA